MKKLFTLFLAVAGIVSTASATKTFYVKDINNWIQMRVHQWNSTSDYDVYLFQNYGATVNVNTKVMTIDQNNYTYYKVTLDDTYTNFMIDVNYGGWTQKTYDLSIADVTDGAYYQLDFISESGDKYNLNSHTIYTYNFSLSTVGSLSFTNIYLWTGSGDSATKFVGNWPGAYFDGTSFTYNSYFDRGTINVIFNQGNEAGKKQTVDMTATKGDNDYLIKDNGGEKYQRVEAVTLNASGYGTYVNTLPVAITGATAYYAVDGYDGTATATTITKPVAGTPMLIKGTANEKCYFEVVDAGTDNPASNAFKAGTGNAVATNPSGTIHNYILNGDTFYWAAGKTVPTNKAYLQLSQKAATTAGARILIFPDDDETQGISAVTTVKSGDAAYYNLSGQRVNAPSKGLFIHDGKKVIIK